MRLAVLTSITTALIATPSFSQCTPHFMPGYAGPSVQGSAQCGTMFDDGSGPALVIGGDLRLTPHTSNFSLGKFNNTRFEPLPIPNNLTNVMIKRVENGAEVLYFAGYQGITSVSRWDGATLTSYPGLYAGGLSEVNALAFYDDGSGETLYAAGSFSINNNPSTFSIAKWTGTTWVALGQGVAGVQASFPARLHALQVFDDGSGPRLFVGGEFVSAAGAPAKGIATWSSAGWQPADAGLVDSIAKNSVRSLAIHNDGSGPRLYAAGVLNTPGPLPSNNNFGGNTHLARLEGGVWQSVIGPAQQAAFATSDSLLSYTDDAGPALYAAVNEYVPSMISQVRVLRNGAWTTVGPVQQATVQQLIVADTGAGPRVTALGNFPVSAWTGSQWSPVETWGNSSPNNVPNLLTVPQATDGSFILGGQFYINGQPSPSPTPPIEFSKGCSRIVIEGQSRLVGSNPSRVALETAQGWELLPQFGGVALSTVLNDGSGDAIYAVDTIARVHKYVNGAWQQVGPTLPVAGSATINALRVYDNGSGPKLYMAGIFPLPVASGGTQYALFLNNGQWVPVPNVGDRVFDIAVFDFGAGPELVIAGGSQGISRWNGVALAPMLPRISPVAITVWDPGSGPKLFAGLVASQAVRYWSGSGWTSLGTFIPSRGLSSVRGFAHVTYPDGSRSLMMGGSFCSANGVLATDLAEFRACAPSCTPDFNSDGDSGTDADIEAFFACLAGNCCPTCATSDFNNDGDFGTDADIESFFRVLAGGPC